jgi:hypothetical protein
MRRFEVTLLDHVIRCDLRSSTARCITGTLFTDPLGNLVPEKEEDEGEDPNREIFEMQCWTSEREEGNQEIGSENSDEAT